MILVDSSVWIDYFNGTRTPVARLLEAHGKVDYFNMWQGIVPSPRSGRTHWPAHYCTPGAFAHLPRGIKEYVSLPVVGSPHAR